MSIDRFAKLMLGFCFLAVFGATTTAHRNPATGYELSIYVGTPALFWALSAFALFIAVLVVFADVPPRTRFIGAYLGGLTMAIIAALPIIRGYHYIGTGDALSHLGTTRDMNAGIFPLLANRYPMVHTLSSILHDATGLELNHTMLIVVIVFIVSFMVFVPITVRDLTGSTTIAYIGLFSGLLLLPLNHLSPSIHIHPTSQAVMFAPVFFYIFFRLYKFRIARHSLLFLILSPYLVMLHPQQAANFLLFFGAIAVVMIFYDFLGGYGFSRRTNWVLPEVTFFGVVFLLWVWNLDTFWSSLENVYMIPFEETQAAETTVSRTVSLTEVGGTLPEVFLKLFFVSSVYALLTGALILLFVVRTLQYQTDDASHSLVPDGGSDGMLPMYIVVGLIPVLTMFFLFVVGGISDQYFRHLGFLMVLGTILGAIALGRGTHYLARRKSNHSARQMIAVILVIFLALSIPVVFASPYIYYTSNHVSEMQMSGYETSFTYQDDELVFDNIRSSTSRYGNAIQGRDIPSEAYYPEDNPGIPNHFYGHSLPYYYDQPTYVPVPQADRINDPVLWEGFRFSHEDFEYLDSEPGINNVQSNDGYDLYLVEHENWSTFEE